MKMENGSRRRFSCKGMGMLLKQGRGRLYIFRRCVILLSVPSQATPASSVQCVVAGLHREQRLLGSLGRICTN
ncbi:hypothetical protein L6164_011328 [Bauhinia variegata]|uniref:Uncharacterized protein n=1 Tax=Bauhinia variegata TaxID=167791 RepID=A0ACB9P5K0_BAUVA|nr:hypothetical protein L6164_011328 [Bauhinia variegata]